MMEKNERKLVSTQEKNQNRKTLSWLLWAVGPFLSFFVMEYMIGNIGYFPGRFELSMTEELLNLIWYYIVSAVIYLFSGSLKISSVVSSLFFLVWSLADSYVYAFRGRVIFPGDLPAARTAFNVMGQYSYVPSAEQTTGVLLIAAYIACSLLVMPGRSVMKRPGRFAAISITAVIAGYIVLFFFSPFLTLAGFEDKLWSAQWNTRENGIVLNFTLNLKFGRIEKPEDYADNLQKLTSDWKSDSAGISDETVTPDIIVVMNEAFSNLSALPCTMSGSCTPFLNSLTENTIKGNVYVSVFGGHTANSEYEFLSGNSVSFLPPGTVAYQMYSHEGDYSLVEQLKSLGYYSIAMHPYEASGWNRVSVYQHYGFDEMHFIEDFENVRNIRDLCSDQSNYENVIRVYEEHCAQAPDEPLFIFNVTMQNHGGYSAGNWPEAEKTVYLTEELEGKYPEADTYLSLMKESDDAFAKLIQYFSNTPPPPSCGNRAVRRPSAKPGR